MATESLLFLGQVPYLFGVFLTIQLWYFVYNHFCPFLDKIPHLRHLNPRRACVKFGLHLVPLAEFLAWQGSTSSRHSKKGDNGGDCEESGELELPDWTSYKEFFISLYKIIPWRFTSRLWGQVNDKNLPQSLRTPLLGLYVWLFGCDVSEAAIEDLRHYKNLQEFFKRQLKPEVRPIDKHHALVSPCDGKVLHFGEVQDCMLEQVKGVTYCLKTFLGPNNWYSDDMEENTQQFTVEKISDEEYKESLNIKEGNKLFHCIIYLAPGDYHRFHSPADWSAAHRRHFPGELFSVNPGIAAWIRGLFNLNERVVLTGKWKYGFFSMAAVGATNVGSINIYFDEDLSTNERGAYPHGVYYDKSLRVADPEDKSSEKKGFQIAKGSDVGEFNLGSTIVLIFEAPEDFHFNMEQGDKVRFGERLGSV